jgi:hypothetical protein
MCRPAGWSKAPMPTDQVVATSPRIISEDRPVEAASCFVDGDAQRRSKAISDLPLAQPTSWNDRALGSGVSYFSPPAPINVVSTAAARTPLPGKGHSRPSRLAQKSTNDCNSPRANMVRAPWGDPPRKRINSTEPPSAAPSPQTITTSAHTVWLKYLICRS